MSVLAQGELTAEEYGLFRRLVYAKSGINLGDAKAQLVKARLGKLVREGGFESFRDYYEFVRGDASGEALCGLIDAISTNTTHLFRESAHFDRLRTLLAEWASDPGWRSRNPELRIWSAACSSGEEPHSIAMLGCDVLRAWPQLEFKVLATDISTRVLERARTARYEAEQIRTAPEELTRRYLQPVQVDGRRCFELRREVADRITYARFNLMSERFPFRNPFDVIFCRNVMIYFDKPTQGTLIDKLIGCLKPGGYLMIGHAESLNRGQHSVQYIEPTVYRK